MIKTKRGFASNMLRKLAKASVLDLGGPTLFLKINFSEVMTLFITMML